MLDDPRELVERERLPLCEPPNALEPRLLGATSRLPTRLGLFPKFPPLRLPPAPPPPPPDRLRSKLPAPAPPPADRFDACRVCACL